MRRFPVLMVALSIVLGTAFGFPARIVHADDNKCPAVDSPNCTAGLPTEVYQKLLVEMQAHPSPDVTPVEVDKKEVNSYSFYRILPDAEIFDAPNGNVIGKVDSGFNFVSIYKTQDGFAMLRNKTWLRRSSLKQSYSSAFAGVLIDKPLEYPIAWVIQASIPSKTPGGVRSTATPAINRYMLLNIFATVRVDGWDWYLVGPEQWLEQRKVARLMPTARPKDAQKWAAIDLYEQVLSAYDGDKLVYATLISSGLTNWQTNIGTFKVWRRVPTTPMSGAMGEPDFYSLPQVPYVMFFDKDISLHGTYWHDGYGFKHSHGCVNMSISDARWIYNWVGDSADLTVTVWDSRSQAS
ncbi:MAG: L,D-transpeptidase [Chloroflexota bacterium]